MRPEQPISKEIKDEHLGAYSDLFSAKGGIDGQDGGIVTSLLIKGIKEGMFDSAIVVQRKEGYNAEAVIAENISEVMAARGTKYLRVRVTPKLRELVDQGKKRIAIVCTPCEAKAARNIQLTLMSNSSNVDVTIIGLFCFEAFNGTKLKEEIKTRLGVDIDKAEKTQIRKGKFLLYLDGKEYSCKVRDLDKATEKACHYCDDFSAQLADISVGSVGSQIGYSTVIVRSEVGKKLLENLDIAKEGIDKEEIIKLSRFKKQRAEKNLQSLTTDNKPAKK
jgi:coenzyme F420 hydrogenase subunit beta